MFRKAVAIVLMLVLASPALSQQAPSPCTSSAGYIIAYFNGVDNTLAEASRSSDALTALYGTTYNGQPLHGLLFYNPTYGTLQDLAEVFKQKGLESPEIRDHWELFWDLVQDGAEVLTPLFLVEFPAVLPAILALRVSISTVRAAISQTNPQSVVDQFVVNMNTLLTERKKVLAVAHSQGNLFVNDVYDRVNNPNSFKVVHVAAATASARGEYTTGDLDQVINLLRIAFPTTLPATLGMPSNTLVSDPRGHSFLDVYMNASYPAFPVIKHNMDIALSNLKDPVSAGSSGLFTVTLTWDGAGDVDLHTFEPNGVHVSYASKTGTSGKLDVDNTVGIGPEHYSVACTATSIQDGLYQIGINNYIGATGRTASVQLTTLQRIYDVVRLSVGPVRGSSGDNSPIPVFRVSVQKQSDGSYKVTMQ